MAANAASTLFFPLAGKYTRMPTLLAQGGGHPSGHFLSTFGRQFGILTVVHRLPLEVCCCVETPALPL